MTSYNDIWIYFHKSYSTAIHFWRQHFMRSCYVFIYMGFTVVCGKNSFKNVKLPEDSNAVAWKTVRLWLMAAGRQER